MYLYSIKFNTLILIFIVFEQSRTPPLPLPSLISRPPPNIPLLAELGKTGHPVLDISASVLQTINCE